MPTTKRAKAEERMLLREEQANLQPRKYKCQVPQAAPVCVEAPQETSAQGSPESEVRPGFSWEREGHEL